MIEIFCCLLLSVIVRVTIEFYKTSYKVLKSLIWPVNGVCIFFAAVLLAFGIMWFVEVIKRHKSKTEEYREKVAWYRGNR